MLADMVWSTIYTILKTGLSKKYPALSYTTSSVNKTEPKLPMLFVSQVDSPTKGIDFERDRQNAIESVIKLEVSSATSLDESRKIIDYAGDILFKNKYIVFSGPMESSTSVYRMILMAKRTIAHDDVF